MKLLEWLGRAKVLNDDISSDALRIASLEAANDALKAETRAANVRSMVWQVKAEDLQDKLEAAQPLIETGRKRKAAVAKYKAKQHG